MSESQKVTSSSSQPIKRFLGLLMQENLKFRESRELQLSKREWK